MATGGDPYSRQRVAGNWRQLVTHGESMFWQLALSSIHYGAMTTVFN